MLSDYFAQTSWNKSISIEKLQSVQKFVEQIKNIQYVGHGGTCVAFVSDDNNNEIIKVCIKNNSMLSSGQKFIDFSNFLIGNNVKIISPNKLLYEDQYFIVYSQDKCIPITNIDDYIMVKILEIIKNLLSKRIKLTDIFYKNFGFYKNDVYIYDYHDYGYFYSDDLYYICHIAHIFNMYYNDTLFYNIDLNIDILQQMNFGESLLPDNVVSLLKCLHDMKFDNAIELVEKFSCEIGNKLVKSYNNYQHLDIDRYGIINLRSHTLEKFNTVMPILNKFNDDFSIVDYGCSLGGIGAKIAQLFPSSTITLNNITSNEILICNEIITKLHLCNVSVSTINAIDVVEQYDVCLYFAILHHVMKSITFDQVINLVSTQTKKYAIIELPFENDVLLKNVINDRITNYNETFAFLESIDKFADKIKDTFNIIDQIKINYGSPDLNRVAFILEKKS